MVDFVSVVISVTLVPKNFLALYLITVDIVDFLSTPCYNLL